MAYRLRMSCDRVKTEIFGIAGMDVVESVEFVERPELVVLSPASSVIADKHLSLIQSQLCYSTFLQKL